MQTGGQQYAKGDNRIYTDNMQGRSAQMTSVGYQNQPYQNMTGVNAGYGGQQPGYGSYGGPGFMPPAYSGMAQPGYPQYQGYPAGGVQAGYMGLAGIMNGIPNGLYIKQKADYLEQIIGCDRQNKYKVYQADNSGNKIGNSILYCKETSGCCDRMCVSSECRAISMDIRREDTEEVVLRLVRECQCTFMCCNRPEMKVYLTENNQNAYIGKVVDPFDCCNHSFRVYGDSGDLRFVVEADCCQLGLMCQCPCDSCEKVVFNVWRGEKVREEQPLLKLGTGSCCKNAWTTADNFSLPFPSNSTWQEKSLLLSLVMMIDYLMFEHSEEKKQSPKRDRGYDSF